MMPTNLKELAIAVMAEHDEETTGSVALDNLINAAMAHDCKADALRARVRTLEVALRAYPMPQERPEVWGPGSTVPFTRAIHDFEKARTAALSGAQPDTALAELVKLRAAIATHRAQKADDRCIEDDDRLYEALGDGIKCDRRVGDKAAMLYNCARFIERRCKAGGWPTYATLEKSLAEREASIVELRRALESIDPCGGFNNHQWTDGKQCSACGWSYETAGKVLDVVAALAQPAPQAALRAFGLRLIDVMHRRILNDEPIDGAREAIVDAVLKGES